MNHSINVSNNVWLETDFYDYLYLLSFIYLIFYLVVNNGLSFSPNPPHSFVCNPCETAKRNPPIPVPSYRFVFPDLPQCGARSETARLVSQQVVAIATGSHVVMAAVEGRGGGSKGEGVIESSGRLLIELIRSQLQKTIVSWHLVR